MRYMYLRFVWQVEEEQHWETTAGLSTLHNRGFFHSEIGEADGTVEFFSMKSKYVEHMYESTECPLFPQNTEWNP